MSPFKDPIAVKERKSSKDFVGPTKDQATTGRYMRAGDDYGSGHKNPVGTERVSNKSPIPRRSFCYNPEDM